MSISITNYRAEKDLPLEPMRSIKVGKDFETYLLKDDSKKKIQHLTDSISKMDNGSRYYTFNPFLDRGLINKAILIGTKYNINMLGIVAVYAKESMYGRAIHCYDNNNFFNIKDFSRNAVINSIYSYHHIDPQSKNSNNDYYYAFSGMEEAMDGFCHLLTSTDRYSGANGFYDNRFNFTDYGEVERVKNKTMEFITFLKNNNYFEAPLKDYKDIIDGVTRRIIQLYK